jgi:hypothetical protein
VIDLRDREAVRRRAESPVVRTAETYTDERGWSVFSLNGKVPYPASRGFKDATRDPLEALLWPNDANIGIATGDGLVVLDVDGETGVASLRAIARDRGRLPLTAVVRTPRGLHVYFTVDREVRCSAGRVGEGIDVRGDGGYVVAPPSRLAEGSCWHWVRGPGGVPLAPAPAWLVATSTTTPATPAPRPQRDLTAYTLAALEGELGRVATAPVGTRNDTLNSASFSVGQLVGGGLVDRATVDTALMDAAARCGLPGREAAATIRSGLDAGEREPRTP